MKELLVVKWWLHAHFAMNVICEKFKMKLSVLGPPQFDQFSRQFMNTLYLQNTRFNLEVDIR